MFFDGASRSPTGAWKEDVQDNVAEIGILFVSPGNTLIPYSSLTKGCSNNTQWQARVRIAIPMTKMAILRRLRINN